SPTWKQQLLSSLTFSTIPKSRVAKAETSSKFLDLSSESGTALSFSLYVALFLRSPICLQYNQSEIFGFSFFHFFFKVLFPLD
ncbi:hypothetical protein Prudu_006753, partial [Prunus dulcis]